MFADRIDAGIQLSDALEKYKGIHAALLAIPRGGVPVAAVMARQLGFPLDVLLTKKIGHPMEPELAIGAVSQEGILLDPRFQVPRDYIDDQVERIRKVLRDREAIYRSGRPAQSVKGRTAIIVDDGIATGYTVRAAIELLRQAGAQQVVVAVPVAAWQTMDALRALADEVICLEVPDELVAIGAHYEDFEQVSDEEVITLLDEAAQHGTSSVQCR
jgi:putative phosphoribosyl transferase